MSTIVHASSGDDHPLVDPAISLACLLRPSEQVLGIRETVRPMDQDRAVTAVHVDRTLSLGRLELFASAPNDPRARKQAATTPPAEETAASTTETDQGKLF